MDCIFCKIAAGEMECNKIYEDNDCIAFHDIEPQAPVHFLVVPKQHIPPNTKMDDRRKEQIGTIFLKISEIAQSLGVEDYRVVTNNGVGAGQTVMHLHFHVLAGRELNWPPG